jgi:hypothetical protein
MQDWELSSSHPVVVMNLFPKRKLALHGNRKHVQCGVRGDKHGRNDSDDNV